jgi:hypothetical protein
MEKSMFKRLISLIIIFTFTFTNLPYLHAQDFSVNQLPSPGMMIGQSEPFAPLVLKGLVVNPRKPLEFQFIVDTGNGPKDNAFIKDESNRLVKYFLAGLTIPEGDLWVNLSPYEKNRITTLSLGKTELGRDLLAQDYILKQLTASLIYPENDLGKEFWGRVYAKAQAQFGTTDVPVNTFNKVWILPDQAQIFENGPAAYVTQSTLKVMLDEDYLARRKHALAPRNGTHSIGADIVRQIVLPEIEKEVNTGRNFAPLRQIYDAMILAKWYKETIQNSLLDALYTNKRKTAGVNLSDPAVKEQIYQRYLQAYKKGVFNYIKEDATPEGQMVPRKYFSGGLTPMPQTLARNGDAAMVSVRGLLLAVTISLSALMPTGITFAQKLGDVVKDDLPSLLEAQKKEDPFLTSDRYATMRIIYILDKNGTPGLSQEIDDGLNDKNSVKAMSDVVDDLRTVKGRPQTLGEVKEKWIENLRKRVNSWDPIFKASKRDIGIYEKVMKKLGASWWQLQTDTERLLWALLLAISGVAGKYKYKDHMAKTYVERTKKKIQKLGGNGNIDELLGYLNDDRVSEAARNALGRLAVDSESQYRIGMAGLKSYVSDNHPWAINLLVKSGRLAANSELQYEAGVIGLESDNSDAVKWSIEMLLKSGKKQIIGMLVKRLSHSDAGIRRKARLVLEQFKVDDVLRQLKWESRNIPETGREIILNDDQRGMIQNILRTLQYKDQIKPSDKIDDIVILGNPNLDVFRQALRLWREHQNSKIVTLGGVGRFTKPLIDNTRNAGFEFKDISSEAVIIRQVMEQMLDKEKEFADLKGQSPQFDDSETRSTNTPENIINYKSSIEAKIGERTPDNPYRIVYLQTPQQQLRTKATIDKYFAGELKNGHLAALSDTSEYQLKGKSDAEVLDNILSEAVRFMIYTRYGNNTIANVELPPGFWPEVIALYNSLKAKDRTPLAQILSKLATVAGPVDQTLQNLPGVQKVFLEQIMKDAAMVQARNQGQGDAAMLAKTRLAFWIRTGSIYKIANMLDERDSKIRQSAREALDLLAKGADVQYKVGLVGLKSSDFEIRIWAIRMLVKSGNKEAIYPMLELSNPIIHQKVREALEKFKVKDVLEQLNRRYGSLPEVISVLDGYETTIVNYSGNVNEQESISSAVYKDVPNPERERIGRLIKEFGGTPDSAMLTSRVQKKQNVTINGKANMLLPGAAAGVRQMKKPLGAPFEAVYTMPVRSAKYSNLRMELGESDGSSYIALADDSSGPGQKRYLFFIYFGNAQAEMVTKLNIMKRFAGQNFFIEELDHLDMNRQTDRDALAGFAVDWLKKWIGTGLYNKDIQKAGERLPSQAPSQVITDKASLAKAPGGIDLNQISVRRTGNPIKVQFDPSQLDQLMQGGFEGFSPVIINITPLKSPFQLLGVKSK